MPLIYKKPQLVKNNPLRNDPSQTGPIRRAFMKMLESKFKELRKRVYQRVVYENQYGLSDNSLVANDPYSFPQSDSYLKLFKEWLNKQLADLFYPELENSWWREYIVKGWQLGAARAYNAWKSPSEFLRSSFNQPVSIEKVKLLASRVLTELESVTAEMATKMSRSLVDGLIQGKSPREVARDMSKNVEGITKQRALTIARTETVRAHAEGQLDVLEGLGMQHVGVAVEWSTSKMGMTRLKNPSPCALCAPMEGVVFTLEEAKGMIPRHPSCMCSFIPANVGEDVQGQTRGYKGINSALRKSVMAEIPKKSKRTLAQQMKKSKWQGATAQVGQSRPKSIFNAERIGHRRRVLNYSPLQPRDKFGQFATTTGSSGGHQFPGLENLEHVKTLGGSTGATLMKDKTTGQLYVRKLGKNAGHLRAEYHAELAYKAAGVNVPESHLYETASGPVKISKYIEGKTLSEFTPAEQRALLPKIQKHFAVDALLANWDVIGMSKDNILVDHHGNIHRIDVGGSLDYRAKGGLKHDAWNGQLTELDSMRTSHKNPSAKWAFGEMTKEQVNASAQHAIEHSSKILEALPEKYHAIVQQRIKVLKTHVSGHEIAPAQPVIPPVSVPHVAQPIHKPLSIPSGSAGLHTHEGLMSHLASIPHTFTQEQVQKFKHLNQNGISKNTVLIPYVGSNKETVHNDKNIELFKKHLPEGTQIKVKIVSMKEVNAAAGIKTDPLGNPTLTTAAGHVVPKPIATTAKEQSTGPNFANIISAHGYGWLPPAPVHATIKTTSMELLTQNQDLPKEARDSLHEWSKGLSMHEKTAVSTWKVGSAEIRKSIAENPPPPPSQEVHPTAFHFYKAINKAIPFEGTVYRGIRDKKGKFPYATEFINHINAIGVGGTWADAAPHCTSRKTSTAHSFASGQVIMEIKTKTGRIIEHQASHFSEREVTGMPHTQYKVLKIKQNSMVGEGIVKHHIVLEEI